MFKQKTLMFITIFIVVIVGLSATAAEKYAVLITGEYAEDDSINYQGCWALANGIERGEPMEEFWNDTFLMWEMLLKEGYSDENIIVLFAGGNDYQPEWVINDERYVVPDSLSPMTDDSATLANVNTVFTDLANTLTLDDFLFVWTFDHGYQEGDHATLGLIDGDIRDDEFAALTDQINCNKKVFWMQQCHSGGFIDDLQGEDTFIITACEVQQSAHTADNVTPDFSPVTENEDINDHR